MDAGVELQRIARQLVAPGRGILAADESTATIGKRFARIGIENTEQNRRAWRETLFTAPHIEWYISGVIMYDETIRQSTVRGERFVTLLQREGVLPGIKVDQGTKPDTASPNEKVTNGLDGLTERLQEYAAMGAVFTKWRAVITIDEAQGLPTDGNVAQNARDLARYAAMAQQAGLVPIVEPEVLMDGSHSLTTCGVATERTLRRLVDELARAGVALEGTIVKTNMVLPAKGFGERVPPARIAEATVSLFKAVLPPNLAGIAFLSGGQGEVEATENLCAMQRHAPLAWQLSFSYGRALQESALAEWSGRPEHVTRAQEVFLRRARMNSLATLGRCVPEEEGAVV